MNVVVIADPHVPVPPVRYGGTERDVDIMCRGLAKRGHCVHLVAGPGSRDYGGGLTVHRAPSAAYASRALRKVWFQMLACRPLIRADVVINHGRLDYLEVVYKTKKPVIHWFHNPLTGTELQYVRSRRRERDYFVAISRAQLAGHDDQKEFSVVHNPVDTAAIPFSTTASKPRYLLFLGRLTHNKGVHHAIEVARRAGLKLVIAGNIPKEAGAEVYFAEAIKPHLGPNCEWIGPYDDKVRISLVAGATALLFPIQWNEPFGLVMIEALAGGTPVIAARRAATPEIIAHGKTGFLCDSIDDMVEAVRRIETISRRDCRLSAERQFGEEIFMQNVEALVAQAVAPGARGTGTS